MDIEGREESTNVEDQRGGGGRTGLAIGGIGGVIVVIVCLVLGVDPRNFMGGGGQPGQVQPNGQPGRVASPAEEKMAHFAKVIFHDTEVVWDEQFKKLGKTYQKPILVPVHLERRYRLRPGRRRHGAVLLPRRPQGLHRPLLLQGDGAQAERAG